MGLAYDEAHSGQLMGSLRVFLLENRSWQRAASRLHIHKQSLVYRMRRVEAPGGDDQLDVDLPYPLRLRPNAMLD